MNEIKPLTALIYRCEKCKQDFKDYEKYVKHFSIHETVLDKPVDPVEKKSLLSSILSKIKKKKEIQPDPLPKPSLDSAVEILKNEEKNMAEDEKLDELENRFNAIEQSLGQLSDMVSRVMQKDKSKQTGNKSKKVEGKAMSITLIVPMDEAGLFLKKAQEEGYETTEVEVLEE